MCDESDKENYWVLFPMYYKKENLAIWILPYNLKLLRISGLLYELFKGDNSPQLLKIYLKGLVVEIVSDKFLEKYFNDGQSQYSQPDVANPSENSFAYVGLRDCAIYHSEDVKSWINLQHFIDEEYYFCYENIIHNIKNKLKKLCSYYCHTKDILTQYVNDGEENFYINYYVYIQDEDGGMDWAAETGANNNTKNFMKNHLLKLPRPYDYDQFRFAIRINFAQLVKNSVLTFIEAEISGNGGKLVISKSIHKAKNNDEFLRILENILRDIFPKTKKARITKPIIDIMKKPLEKLKILYDQDKEILSYPEKLSKSDISIFM